MKYEIRIYTGAFGIDAQVDDLKGLWFIHKMEQRNEIYLLSCLEKLTKINKSKWLLMIHMHTQTHYNISKYTEVTQNCTFTYNMTDMKYPKKVCMTEYMKTSWMF